MFDNLKNLANLPALMAKAGEMKARMQALQEELGQRVVSADAGDGRVRADVNGRLEVVRVRIDRERMDVANIEALEDLIVAAIRAAQVKAAAMTSAEMQKAAADLGLPPGMLPGQ